MNVTQIDIKDLTNEEFVHAYKKNKIKFRLQGSGFSFNELLVFLFAEWVDVDAKGY